MSWFDDILGFVDKHGDTIGKAINVGKNVFSAFDQNNSQQAVRSGYLDILRQKALLNEQQTQREMDYLNQLNASSGRSSGPSISPAAMAAQQKAQLKAQKKGYRQAKKLLEEVSKGYQPFVDAGKAVLPKQVANYSQFLDDSSMLSHYLTGAAMKKFQEGSTPVSEIKVDPKAYKVAVPQYQQGAISLADILKAK